MRLAVGAGWVWWADWGIALHDGIDHWWNQGFFLLSSWFPLILRALLLNAAPIIQNEISPSVRLQLLSSALKLFFKRPPEMQSMLGRLLNYEVNEEKVTDVHDRALFYFRLLMRGVEDVRFFIFFHFEPEEAQDNPPCSCSCRQERSLKSQKTCLSSMRTLWMLNRQFVVFVFCYWKTFKHILWSDYLGCHLPWV